MGQKAVSYPQLLDNFGKELVVAIDKIKHDTLKPAIMKDALELFNALFWTQQLLTMSYNLFVQNYEQMMGKIVEVEKKNADLETRMAGYSSEINTLRGKINKLERRE